MRAFRLNKPRDLELIELPDPQVADGQVLVRMKETAVCGSDLVFYLGTLPMQFPLKEGSPSHECVGEVVESRMAGYAPGDMVMVFPPGQNGLRELVVATEPKQILKLPEGGNLTEMLLGQLLGTVIHAARGLGDVMSEKIAIIGQGPVGQLFNHLMWNLGAQTIIGIDRVPERLAVSPKMHATHTLLNGRDDVNQAVLDLTDGEGADVVIEASGYDETIRMMVELVRRHGRVLMFGSPKHMEVTFPIKMMYAKRLPIYTTAGPDIEKDTKQAIRYILDGRVNVKPILTHRFPFVKAREALELFAERKDGCVKIILDYTDGNR